MALFNGRVILLTGAASGIGLATAHLLASRGATISIADANAAGLEKAEKEIKAKNPSTQILPYVVDVRDEEQVKRWVETVVSVHGRVDGAANLAGVIGEFLSLILGRWRGVWKGIWEEESFRDGGHDSRGNHRGRRTCIHVTSRTSNAATKSCPISKGQRKTGRKDTTTNDPLR